ncbi:MAG: hypothetical protein U5N86_03080 [Planctomycetota bacterium]|nr:hypothetical protein [Planctomycetota bacterium]
MKLSRLSTTVQARWTGLISADVPWLSFDIQGGVLASGEEAVVKVYADSAFLPLSTQAYTATISLTSDVASNSPLEVLTTVRVLPPDMLIGESDSYGHVAVSEDYNWIDIRAQDFDLSSFYSTFDDEALGFYLPFDMELFGTTLAGSEDVFYLSTNGLLTFASAGSMNSENTPLPSQITPNAVIAPFWADLRMTENSRLYGRIFGSDNGNSRFVIEWYRFVNKEDGQEYTFQVEVFEYGDVILRYESDFTSLTVGSIGIEDFTGTEGLQVALNTQTDFPPPSTAIRITTRGQEPLLSLTPLWQQVNVAAGAEFQATVGVRNTGSGTLEWSLSAAGPSMSLSSSSGVGDADITVSGSAAGLSAGQYLCTITGTSDNGYVWDDTVRILLNVYSGTPDTVAIALDAGWNAVYVPVYVRAPVCR